MTKLRKLILVSLAIVGIAIARISNAQTPSESDKAEVTALNQRLMEAFNKKDVTAVMSCYSDDPNAIFLLETIPFQLDKAELAKEIAMFFQSGVTDYRLGMESVDVLVSGDLAVVHCILHNTWTDKSGAHSETSRYTQVDRKDGGKWLIWHDHASFPYDPATGKAVLNAKP
jgi:uncharacterized protein (TIGR02246 family)